MEEVPRVGRRSLLQRGVVLLGAVLGGRLLADRPVEAASLAPPAPPGATTLKLTGRNWHVRSVTGRGKDLPRQGDHLNAYGELIGPDGARLGEFYSTSFYVHAPYGDSPAGATTIEMHTFNLEGGTLVGIGTGHPLGADSSVHTIVGGSGKYLGARGMYTARQQPQEFGGDGSAEFVFTLLA